MAIVIFLPPLDLEKFKKIRLDNLRVFYIIAKER